jgi:hypothetical protein
MTTASLPLAPTDRRHVSRIVTAGATVGVLDAIAAMTFATLVRGSFAPGQVWRGVARALLGEAAATGGVPAAAFGLAMHFGVALGWATIYGLAYQRFDWLRAATRSGVGAVVTGAVYGLFVWTMMSLVIVPMTLARSGPPFTRNWFIMAAIHAVVVGQPIAWIVRRP